MMSSTVKCPHCQQWNESQSNDQQRCSRCNGLLQAGKRSWTRSSTDDNNFMDSLPPYAKYIFMGIVAVIGGIVVLALA
jgi:phage FluMu protein Com